MGVLPDSSPHARILVVDDQSTNIQVIGSILGPLGYDVIPARDGPTALQRMARRPPDLVLLDMIMPQMDGCEVLRRLRKNPDLKLLPVIVLSAAHDKDLIVQAFEAGAMDYITKPFHQAELISRVRCHLELKQARDQLEQMALEKDQILGLLTHDLKNKLGGIQMSAQVLCKRLSGQADERLRQLADNIAEASDQVLGHLKEFLANAAADHQVKVRPAPVDLARLVRQVAAAYQENARRKKIQIKLQLPEAPVQAMADANALRQVLENLVSNALKFSPSGKEIQLRLVSRADRTICEVEDQGPGFTDEDRSRLFRRYARLSARPTGDEPSTGLGLSIARTLVRAMDGTLDLRTQPGRGSTFSVSLPRPPAS